MKYWSGLIPNWSEIQWKYLLCFIFARAAFYFVWQSWTWPLPLFYAKIMQTLWVSYSTSTPSIHRSKNICSEVHWQNITITVIFYASMLHFIYEWVYLPSAVCKKEYAERWHYSIMHSVTHTRFHISNLRYENRIKHMIRKIYIFFS